MASTYLTKTFGTPTSDKIFTLSTWLKKSDLGNTIMILSAGSDGSNECNIRFVTDQLQVAQDVGGSAEFNISTTAVFRDVSAWYHIVVAVDTSQATSSDRIKMYVNGVQQTVGGTYPSQNIDTLINASASHSIGKRNYDSAQYFDGSMTHYHFIDGIAYDASAFGETDATTGIWKPKTAPSVTYGTNGFFLKFENSGAFGTDSSGNANNFTVNGTMTQTVDTPSNVFATLDALQDYAGWHTLSNGNTSVSFATGPYGVSLTNLGITSGKYYCEVKCVAEGSPKGCSIGTVNKQIGFGSYEYMNGSGYAYWRASGTVVDNAGNTEYTGNSWGTGDVLMIALDLDNNNLYFGKNGTWENSGDPTSGATGTGAVTLSASPDYPFFFCCDRNDSGVPQFSWNFGNGYFGTTAVSSAENPDDGVGIFEYDVPTGYLALCTKSINAQEYS